MSHALSRLHHSISHSINPLINFFGLALTRSCFFGSHHVAHTRHIFYEPRAPDSKFFYERSNSHHTRTHPISHSSHRSHLKNLFFFFYDTRHTSIDCIDPSHVHQDRKKFFDRGFRPHHEPIELMARATTPHVVLRIPHDMELTKKFAIKILDPDFNVSCLRSSTALRSSPQFFGAWLACVALGLGVLRLRRSTITSRIPAGHSS